MAWSRRGTMRLKVQGVGPIASTIRTRKSWTDLEETDGRQNEWKTFLPDGVIHVSALRPHGFDRTLGPGSLGTRSHTACPVRRVGRRLERQAGLVHVFSISPSNSRNKSLCHTPPCAMPQTFYRPSQDPAQRRRPHGKRQERTASSDLRNKRQITVSRNQTSRGRDVRSSQFRPRARRQSSITPESMEHTTGTGAA
jgi:hypothetical protein